MKSQQNISIIICVKLICFFVLIFILFPTNALGQDYRYDADVTDAFKNKGLTDLADKMRSQIMLDDQITMRGAIKIKAGKATTRFVPSASGYQYSARLLKWDPDQPQTVPEQVRILQAQVKQFEERMIKAGRYSINDNVDAANFAYALSYEACYDKKLSGADLQNSQQTWQQDRKMLLSHAFYQGAPDMTKQDMYINDAVLSLQAIEWRERARRATNEKEKQWAIEKAKQYANYKLKLNFNSTSTNAVNGNAPNASFVKPTTTFTRNHNLLLSQTQMRVNHPYHEINEWTKLMREFDAEVERRGGATNDAAWSNAVSFAYAYEVYTDGQVKLNDAQLKSVLERMRKDVLAMEDYQAFSNDDKQKYYEMTALNIMIVYDAYRDGIKKGFGQYYTKVQAIKDAAARVSLLFAPNPIEAYMLTPTGFVKKQ